MSSQQLQAFANVIRIDDPFLQRLQHVLLTRIPTGNTALPCVAVELNCSARTLQRELSGYNLTYQSLLDGVREQLALRYMRVTTLSLAEILLLLGFSDQSAFTQAIKKRQQLSPGKFRKAQKGP